MFFQDGSSMMFFPSCPSFHFVYLFRGCYHDKLLSWDDHAMTITSRAWPLRWTIASEARQPLGKGFWKVWCFSTSKVVNTMPWTYHLGWFIHVSTRFEVHLYRQVMIILDIDIPPIPPFNQQTTDKTKRNWGCLDDLGCVAAGKYGGHAACHQA